MTTIEEIKARRAAYQTDWDGGWEKAPSQTMIFIAHAPADIDYLLAEVARLQAECEALRDKCRSLEKQSDDFLDRLANHALD